MLDYEKKIDLYREQLLLAKEKINVQEKALLDLQKTLDEFKETTRFQEDKVLMQQQQILNNDDKFDGLLNKIANLKEESMKLRVKFVGVVFSIGGIIVCLMVIYMVLNFK